MNQEIIVAISEFMKRATLQASEIEAFQKCMVALQEAYAAQAPTEEGPEGD